VWFVWVLGVVYFCVLLLRFNTDGVCPVVVADGVFIWLFLFLGVCWFGLFWFFDLFYLVWVSAEVFW